MTDTTFEMIYLGACTLADGKQGARWISKEAFDETADEKQVDAIELVRRVSSAFGKKTATGRSIGGIYSTKGTIENKIVKTANFGSDLKIVGRCEHPLIMAFEADDWNAREADRSRKASNAIKNDPLITRELNNTVMKLRKLPVRQRLTVIDAIRSELLNRALHGRD
jgi:hypothetical protein